ncbi:MAG: DUF2752 domain-containing protein [Lachnospiraceae bacterium]|nr:DUF2752 domain-containing protein [Lachnospiraceae bacterium]
MKQTGARILADIKEYWPAALVLLVYTAAVNLIFHNFCPMVIVSGLPCPGCGLTRSIVYLITGRLSQSLYINPMGIPIACILIYFFWNRYIIGRKAKGMTVLITCVTILLLVIYIYRMFMLFPNRVPYVYTENNILSRYFPFYEQILHGFGIL